MSDSTNEQLPDDPIEQEEQIVPRSLLSDGESTAILAGGDASIGAGLDEQISAEKQDLLDADGNSV